MWVCAVGQCNCFEKKKKFAAPLHATVVIKWLLT
jgi:hypothetical protein